MAKITKKHMVHVLRLMSDVSNKKIDSIISSSLHIDTTVTDGIVGYASKKDRKKKNGLSREEKTLRQINKLAKNKKKLIKKVVEFENARREADAILNSEHNCIRRNKKCFTKNEIERFIQNASHVVLNKYYCKKCKAWHLTSQTQNTK